MSFWFKDRKVNRDLREPSNYNYGNCVVNGDLLLLLSVICAIFHLNDFLLENNKLIICLHVINSIPERSEQPPF